MILDDAQGYMSSRGLSGIYGKPMTQPKTTHEQSNGDTGSDETGKARVFVLSSFNELSGKRQAKALHQYLRKQQNNCSKDSLDDLAFTLGERRSMLPWKVALSTTTPSQLAEAVASDSIRFVKLPKAEKLGFIFTGQGAQWHGMGRELISQYPVFQRSLDLADQYLKALGASWSVTSKFLIFLRVPIETT